MTFVAELKKGNAFPKEVFWPEDLPAFVPLSGDFFSRSEAVPSEKIQMLCRIPESTHETALVWLDSTGKQCSRLNLPEWILSLQQESYRPEHQIPMTARLPFHYHHIPGGIRNVIASFLLQKNKSESGQAVFPVSDLNVGPEVLLSLLNARWKSAFKAPTLCLTHDIDTGEGFARVEKICDLEEKFGFRSSWNIVPKNYKIPMEILERIQKRGFEIGLHGLWHTNREAFLSKEKLVQEFTSLKPLLEKFEIQGYRGPSWYRTQKLNEVLSQFFRYDLSCPDNDLACPGGPGGVGFMRPFLIRPNLVELPCTLPFEVPLFSGVNTENLVEYWDPKVNFIQKNNALLLVNTHPDSNYLGSGNTLVAYEQFLKRLADQRWNCELPRVIAARELAP